MGLDGARRGQSECPTGARWGPDGVADGRIIYFEKKKLTCSVYVSCKSSSVSDVSDAGWM
jgi:hypothetical protein